MKSFLNQIQATLRDGFQIWWLALLIPGLSVLPEFAQHIAEINIGMFASEDAAMQLANDPTRWAFGYGKLAGLLLAILTTIRFLATHGSIKKWWDLRDIAWLTLGFAIGISALTALPEWLLAPYLGKNTAQALSLILSLATLPLLILFVAALAGDRKLTLRRAFTKGWLPAIKMIVILAAIWAPLQWVHGQNHSLAFGATSAAVWALMIFDSLLVGVMATMAGSAMFHGYRATFTGNIQGEASDIAEA